MSEYQWCPYCHRASRKSENAGTSKDLKGEKLIKEYRIDLTCPYDDCDKGWCELQDWDEMRKINKKLPEVPENKKQYSVKGMSGDF